MASSATFELVLQLKDQASKGLGQAAQQGGLLKNALSFAAGGAILGGITAIGKAAGDMFGDAIGEAKEWNTQIAQVDAVLASTGGKAGITKDAILELNKSLSAGGGFSAAADDAVLSGQNMLLTFTNIGQDVFPEASRAMLDMATKMNNGVTPGADQLKTTSIQLGKALNDPIKGLGALSKVGVSFTAQQKEQIKAMTGATTAGEAYFGVTGKMDAGLAALLGGVKDTDEAFRLMKNAGLEPFTAEQEEMFRSIMAGNGTMEAQKLILKELNTEFGGSATGAMNSFEGQQQLVAEQFNNIKQTIGEALMPILSGLTTFLSTTVVPAISAMLPVLGSVFGFIRDNAVPILLAITPVILSQLIPAFVGWATTMMTVTLPALAATMAPIIAAAAPFIALGAAVAALWFAFENNFLGIRDLVMPIVDAIKQKLAVFWEEIQPKLVAAWEAIKAGVEVAWNFIQNTVIAGVQALKAAWDSDWGGIRTIIETVWNVISTIVTTAWNLISGLISAGLSLLSGDWEGAWNGIKGALEGVWNAITTQIIPNALGGLWTLLTEFLPKLIGQLAEWGAAFIGWVVPRIPELIGKLFELLGALGGWLINDALPAIVTKLGEWAKAFLDWIGTSVLPFLGGKLGEIWTAITTWIGNTARDILEKVKSIGTAIIDGIKAGISGAWDAFVGWIQSMLTGFVDGIKSFFGISSPSQMMYDEVGMPLVQGMQAGWNAAWPGWEGGVRTDMERLAGEVSGRAAQIAGMMNNLQMSGSATSSGTGASNTNPNPGGGNTGGMGGIHALASGGIVRRPVRAIVGEGGPEAVVPLDRLERWMGAGRGGGPNIYVTVNAPLLSTSKQQAADEIAELLYDRLQGRV